MGVGSLKPMSSSALKNCLLSFSASKPMRPKVLPNVSCGMPKAEVNHTGFEDMAPLKGEEAAKALVALRDGTDWVRQLGKVLSHGEGPWTPCRMDPSPRCGRFSNECGQAIP